MRTAPRQKLDRGVPFFEALLRRDASGGSWLPRLLEATPYARARLGDLAASPGWLVAPLAVRGANGRLACFDYPANPPRELLRWFVDHPEQLHWVQPATVSPEAAKLRRALVLDDPPGAQMRAQERARELLVTRSALAREWWRFEQPARLDCVLITPRLVVTIVAKRDEGPRSTTPWYPARTELVRDLEAAKQLAAGRRWGSILLSDRPLDGGADEALARSLPEAAPHLDDEERGELHASYLGNLTWDEACAVAGIPRSSLPM